MVLIPFFTGQGIHELSKKEIEKLERIRLKGKLLEVFPSKEDKPSLNSLPKFLIPSANSKKHFGFEIWLYQNRFSFYVYSRDERLIEEFKVQLNALYPKASFNEPLRLCI